MGKLKIEIIDVNSKQTVETDDEPKARSIVLDTIRKSTFDNLKISIMRDITH